MKRASHAILIVDDEIETRNSLSAVLQSKGYVAESAASAKEAIEKAKTKFFDILLLDMRLPDMEGPQLLEHFQRSTPETIKIIITGYPSIENASRALNIGADSYLTKPIDPDSLLKTIEGKLKERKRRERITAERLADWVRRRARNAQLFEFQEFLEKTAKELALFGVTETQAKIYVGLNALGVASVSEIASLSKIRREEVYRMMPKLERCGLVTRKLGTPRRFSATEAKSALDILTKEKVKAMEEEISNLRQKKFELIAHLKTGSILKMKGKDDDSIEAFFGQEQVILKLVQMLEKTERRILLVGSLDQLAMTLLRTIKQNVKMGKNHVSAKIITDESWLAHAHVRSGIAKKQAEIRHIEMLPFNLLIIDEKEAMWGGFQFENEHSKTFLTNSPMQIGILKRAFESLWQQSQKIDDSLNQFTAKYETIASKEK